MLYSELKSQIEIWKLNYFSIELQYICTNYYGLKDNNISILKI
jgi:hypothetical protein